MRDLYSSSNLTRRIRRNEQKKKISKYILYSSMKINMFIHVHANFMQVIQES